MRVSGSVLALPAYEGCMKFIDAKDKPIAGLAELTHFGSDSLIALTLGVDGELDHKSLDPGEYIAVVKNSSGTLIFGPNRFMVTRKNTLVRLTASGRA
jgi:hypothetical protein